MIFVNFFKVILEDYFKPCCFLEDSEAPYFGHHPSNAISQVHLLEFKITRCLSSICHSQVSYYFFLQSFAKPITNQHCELTELFDRLDDHCTYPASSHMAALRQTVCN